MRRVADKDDMRDWVEQCDGEGRERVVRDGRDSGVVMMAAIVEDGSGGRQRQRQTTTVVDDNGMQDWATDYDGKGQEQASREGRVSGNDGCSGGRWHRQTTMVAADNDGDSRQ
jgi:hypothetical protein